MKVSTFLLCLCAAIGAATAQAQKYEAIDLTPPGVTYIYAYGLNNKSQVVGVYSPANNPSRSDAFIWQNGVLQRMINDTGVTGSVAYRINNDGWAVGTYDRPKPGGGFMRHAFVWANGILTDINPVGAHNSIAAAINDSGKVVGSFYDTTSSPPGVHTFLWDNGIITDLGTFGGNFSGAVGINLPGEMVGSYDPDDSVHGFIYGSGGFTDMGAFVYPEDINDLGQVVGGCNCWIEELGGRYGTAFIWENGAVVDLPVEGYPARAYGINERGQVVGYAAMSNYGALMWENHEMTYLNTLVDSSSGFHYSWSLATAAAINDDSEILARGVHIYSPSTQHEFLLRPLPMRVTKPAAGDLCVAGTWDTIRWVNAPAGDSLHIFFSKDSGESYALIAENVPAVKGYHAWKVPDGTLSTDCFIEIMSASDPTIDTTSGRFRVKGYELTRLDNRGKYVRYRPPVHGWSFPNDSSSMWPSTWWSGFNYASGTDPYTGQAYPEYFSLPPMDAQSRDFIDWPLFVETFGTNACYFSTSLGLYRPSAVLAWSVNADKWGGSCFGMAVGSFLAFDDSAGFFARYPAMGPAAALYSIPVNDGRRKILNRLWAVQMASVHRSRRGASFSLTPTQTVHELQAMLLSDTRNDRVLTFYNYDPGNTGGHAVNPYKIAPHPNPAIVKVYVYDNNFPGDDSQLIAVDTVLNLWTYFPYQWHGQSAFFLAEPVFDYLIPPDLPKQSPRAEPSSGQETDADPRVQVYFNGPLEFVITKPDSGAIGLRDSIFNTLSGAVPIIPMTGRPALPIGFDIPAGSYTIESGKCDSPRIALTFIADDVQYAYMREGASGGDHDLFTYGDGLTLHNGDTIGKVVTVESIIPYADSEKVIDIAALGISGSDSVRVNGKTQTLANYGDASSYDLRLRIVTRTSERTFHHTGIALGANCGQTLVVDWADLSSQQVVILVDDGNDGIVDDTLVVENQITGVSSGHGPGTPTAFRLHQNYPNPFNPRTTISYELPRAAYVTVRIYDAFGRESATLVEGRQGPGVQSVEWDAADMASGVYFCKLQAGGFVATMKLLLVR